MALSELFKRKVVPGRPEKINDDLFQAEVLESPVPVVVDFWATWCAPCQVMGGLLEEIGPEFAGRVRIVKLNVEESPQTAARFGISSIPTLIVFKKGKAVEKKVGLIPMQPLRQMLERHAS